MLIRDGFSSTVRRATQEGRESFEVAQQSCRRKDARSSGVNFPDSALGKRRVFSLEDLDRFIDQLPEWYPDLDGGPGERRSHGDQPGQR